MHTRSISSIENPSSAETQYYHQKTAVQNSLYLWVSLSLRGEPLPPSPNSRYPEVHPLVRASRETNTQEGLVHQRLRPPRAWQQYEFEVFTY
jgi:hypothetical protein